MSLAHIIDNTTRVGLLKKLIHEKKFLKIIEVHNGLSGLIASDTTVSLEDGSEMEFDGMWESSLTDSASKGFPDVEIVSFDSRLQTINQILEVTKKPMIVDGDTGGDFNHFEYLVKRLERAGVSMVIIEDKKYPKRNSLESGTKQDLEDIPVFTEKLRRGLAIKSNPDFMIVSRIESLIAGYGMKDAIERAENYLKANCDGIMIHSKSSDPEEILTFAEQFYSFPEELIRNKILICVPTTYNTITNKELHEAGFHCIIHANHLLRASYKAMEHVCQKILLNDRSFEVDNDCAPVKQIFKIVGFIDIKEKDKTAAQTLKSKIKVIIPAAGADNLAQECKKPVSLIEINGKPILQRQMETLAKTGIDNIVVIKGYEAHQFEIENIRYLHNPDYQNTHILKSLLISQEEWDNPFLYINSDILFSENIIHSILTHDNDEEIDILLVVDDSYQHHKHNIDKQLDLVRTSQTHSKEFVRKVTDIIQENVEYIGKKINKEIAHYEFIGMAYFSRRGAKILKDVYNSLSNHAGNFHESESLQKASFTDIIQEIVERKYPVKVLKTYQGWMEIHNRKDMEAAQYFYK